MAAGPKVIKSNLTVEGASFAGMHRFQTGHEVPVYEVRELSALNQIIGYAKYLNKDYGNVYYRGVSRLYDNIRPAIMRDRTVGAAEDLVRELRKVANDRRMKNSLDLQPEIPELGTQDKRNKLIRKYNGFIVEAVLQHYSGTTRFLDLVDNHWIALWMGMHRFHFLGDHLSYCRPVKRGISPVESVLIADSEEKREAFDPYLYIMMLAVPYLEYSGRGVWESEDFVEVDLRKALPSVYLRPHAQHALVVRRRAGKNVGNTADYFDMAGECAGIVKVRIDRADEWIGRGGLMTKENLFPSPSVDVGYNTLLRNPHLFEDTFRIVKYF